MKLKVKFQMGMKRNNLFVTGILILLFSAVKAQTEWGVPYNEELKAVIYEEVVQTPGLTQAVLYERAFSWISHYFTAGTGKITEKNPESGIIKLKDRITLFRMEKKNKVADVVIDYNLDIYVKDGKYKYVFRNFRVFQGGTSPGIEIWMDPVKCEKEVALERYANLNSEISAVIENLKNYMMTGPVRKEDTW